MSRLSLAAVVLFCCAAPEPALAQNFLMNSAETINRGNFKIALFPAVLFGEDDADNQWGVGSRFGYGFTDSFDVEGKLAFFDGFKLYGLDGEYWLVKGDVDFSIQLGGHWASVDDGFDSKALDLAGLVSGNVADKLELYGGLSALLRVAGRRPRLQLHPRLPRAGRRIQGFRSARPGRGVRHRTDRRQPQLRRLRARPLLPLTGHSQGMAEPDSAMPASSWDLPVSSSCPAPRLRRARSGR